MKSSRAASSAPSEAGRNLGVVALLACLILPSLLLSVFKSNMHPLTFGNMQLAVGTIVQLGRREDDTGASSSELRIMPGSLQEEGVINHTSNQLNSSTGETPLFTGKEVNETVLDIQMRSSPESYRQRQIDKENITNSAFASDTQTGEAVNTEIIGDKQTESSYLEENSTEKTSNTEKLTLQRNMWCDISHERYDTCFMNGDVRILGSSSTLILASPSTSDDTTLKIKPYARKWESPVMETINELTLKSSSKQEELPRCTVNHNVPAIVFSTGGFIGNFFHDFTDVLVPLFVTSRHYQGQVQFLINNYNAQWVNKYRAILSQLSRYQIINLDAQEGHIHCFTQAQIGLMSHKAMAVDPAQTPGNYTMDDFRDMLRTSFSLKRRSIKLGTRKPRLLILQRKGARSLVNMKDVVALGRRSGFKVVVAGPEEVKNLSRFAHSVNSADVLMGVHGAGLTNLVFLPTDAILIQIVPWGGLKWACWHAFGEPAAGMGVKYLEYEIKEEESTLIQQYPRNDPVFTDPESVQKQGWGVLWSVFLQKQNVKIDVSRFKPTLVEARQSLR